MHADEKKKKPSQLRRHRRRFFVEKAFWLAPFPPRFCEPQSPLEPLIALELTCTTLFFRHLKTRREVDERRGCKSGAKERERTTKKRKIEKKKALLPTDAEIRRPL